MGGGFTLPPTPLPAGPLRWTSGQILGAEVEVEVAQRRLGGSASSQPYCALHGNIGRGCRDSLGEKSGSIVLRSPRIVDAAHLLAACLRILALPDAVATDGSPGAVATEGVQVVAAYQAREYPEARLLLALYPRAPLALSCARRLGVLVGLV